MPSSHQRHNGMWIVVRLRGDIYRAGMTSGSTYIFQCERKAVRLAEELAISHPGEEFGICKVIGYSTQPQIPSITTMFRN